MNKTNYLENLFLNATIRNSASAKAEIAACNLVIGLFMDVGGLGETADNPASATEVAVSGYSRVSYATLSAGFPSPTAGSMTNTGTFTWTLTGAVPSAITAIAIIDDATTPDHIWWYWNLASPFTPGANSTVTYIAGTLTILEA